MIDLTPKQAIDPTTTEIAILLDDAVNKYHPGVQVFRLQSVAGLKENSIAVDPTTVSIPNLMNKKKPNFGEVNMSAVMKLELPRDVTRNFPMKYIPAGTRFIVSFSSGDITKPVIVGREFA